MKRKIYMNALLYNKKVNCPVCNKEIVVTKVKSKSVKVKSRDTDLCVHYEDLNPLFYDIWVCEFCGYSNFQEKFETILSREIKAIKDNISGHWASRSFSGERTIDTAIETFKLALLNYKVRNGKNSDIARICLRIAWLYRSKNDTKELDFLNFAVEAYRTAYEKERFPIDRLDEYTCMYIIGELYRRLDKYEDCLQWFSKVISSSGAKNVPNLLDMTRDQIQLAKDAMASQKS